MVLNACKELRQCHHGLNAPRISILERVRSSTTPFTNFQATLKRGGLLMMNIFAIDSAKYANQERRSEPAGAACSCVQELHCGIFNSMKILIYIQ